MRFAVLPIAVSFLAIVLTATSALAESSACAGLVADLAALGHRSAPYDPYGDAVQKQSAALDRATSDYQRACGTGLFSRPAPACPALGSRIQEMQANLAKLQRAAPRFQPRSDDPDRARLQALIRQNRCGETPSNVITSSNPPAFGITNVRPVTRTADPYAAPAQGASGRTFTLPGPNGPMLYREDGAGRIVALGPAVRVEPTQPDRRSNIITNTRIDDPPPDRRRDPYNYEPDPADDDQSGDLSGTYRTLCVRTCDGYYFPISYAASHNQFGNDADICRARCPGTETRLFVVKTPGETGEQSFAPDTGEPYTKLPNALRYRREVVNACTCGRADPALMPLTALPQEDVNRDGSQKIGDVRADLPVPEPRPARGEDPETLADMAQEFVPHVIEPFSATTAVAPDALKGTVAPKTVRVVGPKFYADR